MTLRGEERGEEKKEDDDDGCMNIKHSSTDFVHPNERYQLKIGALVADIGLLWLWPI